MINWKDWKTYVILMLPVITGYITSYSCTVGKNAGSNIPARPPSWVFGVVWAVLYLFLGISWVVLRQDRVNQFNFIDGLMCFTIVGLVMWVIMYGCKKNKKGALYVLLVIFVLSMMLFGYSWNTNRIAAILITPFVGWVTFAMLLNYTEVNNS